MLPEGIQRFTIKGINEYQISDVPPEVFPGSISCKGCSVHDHCKVTKNQAGNPCLRTFSLDLILRQLCMDVFKARHGLNGNFPHCRDTFQPRTIIEALFLPCIQKGYIYPYANIRTFGSN